MRRQIYAGGDHAEIALNLGKLGEAERARGCLAGAREHFASQRAMLERLILTDGADAGGPPLQAVVRLIGSASPPAARALAQLLQAVRWQRTSAREDGDTAAAAELGAEAQQLQHAIQQDACDADAAPARTKSPCSSPLVAPACACRDTVRSALLELKQRRSGTPSVEAHSPPADCVAHIARAAEALAAVLNQCKESAASGGEELAPREVEARADSAYGEEDEEADDEEQDAKEDGASEARLRRAVSDFVAEIRSSVAGAPVDEQGAPASPTFERRLFGACDALRARLREEGIVLTDVVDDSSRADEIMERGDYMLSPASLAQLQKAFGTFTVDAFASGATAQLPRFWSSQPSVGAAAVDAFAQEWAGEHLLAHAPVNLLVAVADKLRATPAASAVVVAPHWTRAPWFKLLSELAEDSIVLPAGSMRALAANTGHVRSWRAVAFYVARRDAPSEADGRHLQPSSLPPLSSSSGA